jgi:hypothetical protein
MLVADSERRPVLADLNVVGRVERDGDDGEVGKEKRN